MSGKIKFEDIRHDVDLSQLELVEVENLYEHLSEILKCAYGPGVLERKRIGLSTSESSAVILEGIGITE
jgi:hypothetical protein